MLNLEQNLELKSQSTSLSNNVRVIRYQDGTREMGGYQTIQDMTSELLELRAKIKLLECENRELREKLSILHNLPDQIEKSFGVL